MTISQKMPRPCKPSENEVISSYELGLVKGMAKNAAHELLLRELRASGLTQKEIARRLRKQPAVISRLIGSGKNLTIATLAELVFAMNGKILTFSTESAFDRPARNTQTPPILLGDANKMAIFTPREGQQYSSASRGSATAEWKTGEKIGAG